MMCSLIAARRGLDVILLEPNKMLGRKLRITGKGRCNVTNNCDIKDFLTNIPGDGRFLYSALNRLSPRDTIQFFESLGLPLKTERGNRVFPVSDNANDVAGTLARNLERSARQRQRDQRTGAVHPVLILRQGSYILPRRSYLHRRTFVSAHRLYRSRL